MAIFRPYTLDVTISTEDGADDFCRVLNRQSSIYSSNVVRDGVKCLWFTARVQTVECHDDILKLTKLHVDSIESLTRSERE